MNSVHSGYCRINGQWRYLLCSICRSNLGFLLRFPLTLSFVTQILWWDRIMVTSCVFRVDWFAQRLGIRCAQGRIWFIPVPVWLTLAESIYTSHCHKSSYCVDYFSSAFVHERMAEHALLELPAEYISCGMDRFNLTPVYLVTSQSKNRIALLFLRHSQCKHVQCNRIFIGFDLAEGSHQMAFIRNNHMFILLRSELSFSASYLEGSHERYTLEQPWPMRCLFTLSAMTIL